MRDDSSRTSLTQGRDNAAANRNNSVPPASSLLHQIDQFIGIFLQLKAWRFLALFVAAVPLTSSAYLPAVLGSHDLNSEPDLTFYRNSDLASAWQLLADRRLHNSRSSWNSTGLLFGGGDGSQDGWPAKCHSVRRCAGRLFRLVSGRREMPGGDYSASPAMLECFMKPSSAGGSLVCAYLYQLAGRSLSKIVSNPSPSFNDDVRLFRYTRVNGGSDSPVFNVSTFRSELKRLLKPKRRLATDSASNCASSDRLFQSVLAISFSISTTSIILYFTVATLSCIEKLKEAGFLQRQFRSGMSATAYWLPLWTFTVAECAVLSMVFLAGHIFQCPEFLLAGRGPGVFAVFFAYCLSIAALVILAATVQSSYTSACMLMLLLNICLITGSAYAPVLIRQGFAGILLIFPPLSTQEYLTAFIASDDACGDRLTSKEAIHYGRLLPCAMITPVLLAAATVYLDFVLADGNGLRLPLYFPLTRAFWLPDVGQANQIQSEFEVQDDAESEQCFEPLIGSLPSIVVDKVSVTYGGCSPCCTIPALRRVSCKIYPGQITTLVGDWGAGKSTLLSILGGSESPARGRVSIDGHPATGPLERLGLRRRVGLCRQTDDLCACLTVRRCLALIWASRGRGAGGNDSTTSLDLLGRLGLAGVEDLTPADLSVGQRRLLSVGLALIGEPDLLLLDEPTQGLDPVARRRVWQLLRDARRPGRTIVVSGRAQDLAEVRADRSVLIVDGEIVGSGSAQFLGRAFDSGHHRLSVSLTASAGGCGEEAEKLLAKLPAAARTLHSRSGRQLQLRVPASDDPEVLAHVVEALERSGDLVEDFQLLRPTPTTDLGPALAPKDGRSVGSNEDISKNDGAPVLATSELLGAGQSVARNLQPSAMRQLCALFAVHSKRQLRRWSSLAGRLGAPSVLLILLALLAAQTRSHFGKVASSLRTEVAATSLKSFGAGSTLRNTILTTCVYDDTDDAPSVLRYRRCKGALTVEKPSNATLADFLAQPDSVGKLQSSCWKLDHICLVLYPGGTWNRKVSANDRQSVTIGILETVATTDSRTRSHNEFVHIYQVALNSLLRHIGVQSAMKLPQLSYSVQHHCLHTEVLLILFAMLFSVFPASFLNDPSEDMETRVYQHLITMGMSASTYWIHTFIIHWCQYALYFLLAFGIIEIWDQFRNPYYFSCICLPALFLGAASNQLSVYTTAAVSRRRSRTVTLSYYCLTLLMPCALHGVARLGRIPVLAMIWLMPQSAPVALILFGMKLAGQRAHYSHGEYVYQMWDMRSTFNGNIFVLNSLIAMPVHVALLGALLCALEGKWSESLERLLGKFRSKGKPQSQMPRDAISTSGEELQTREGSRNLLEVRDLTKTFSNGKVAVNSATFELAAGETLTLLGPSGSGKTVAAAIVAGEEIATSGHCRVLCERRLRCAPGAGRHDPTCGAVGYCPQYSPLFDCVTVSEHLHFCARIRGVPPGDIAERVRRSLSGLALGRHRRRLAGSLSRGCRRRLCVAMALLSSPDLLVLDDATTGLGPDDVRLVRRALRRLRRLEGLAVLATTVASVVGDDATETGSGRVGVVNRGRLVALGTVRQLRDRYGDFYTLDALLESESEDTVAEKKLAVADAVLTQFPGSLVSDEGRLWTQFSVPRASFGKLSVALRWLTRSEIHLGLQQLSLYQMPLEHLVLLQQTGPLGEDARDAETDSK